MEKHTSHVFLSTWQGSPQKQFVHLFPHESPDCSLTFISAVVENIESFHRLFSSLLASKDEVDPLVEVGRHVFGLLQFKSCFLCCNSGCRGMTEFYGSVCCWWLTRAFMCFLIKSSLDVAQGGSNTSATRSWDNCKRPKSKPSKKFKRITFIPQRTSRNGTGLPLLVERLTIHVLQELREVEELRDELLDVGRALHASLPGRRHRVELSVCDVEPETTATRRIVRTENTREAGRYHTVATVLTCRSAAGYAGWWTAPCGSCSAWLLLH